MSDINLTQLIVNHLTRDELHNADFTDHANELFVQKDHAGVSIGGVGVDALDTTNITNCITNIPQDIKLELNNGTLTLKAGSKAYIPNGAGVFTPITITTGKSAQFASNGPRFAYVRQDGALYVADGLDHSVSGAIDPLAGIPWHVWYDTTNNILYRYGESGTTPIAQNFSLPIAIVTVSNGAISSIDKVFNGFGYIGSTVFALPGVKGLYPDGRNADGTLKSDILNITRVFTYNVSSADIKEIRITNAGLWGYQGYIVSDTKPSFNFNMWYSPVENIMYDTGNGTLSVLKATVGISIEYNGTRITSFKTKTVFHALDYNDSEYIANCAMPSDRYVDLTLPVSGGTITAITAPADGYITLTKDCSAAGQMVYLRNTTSGLNSGLFSNGADRLRCNIAVSKGDVITIAYTASGTTETFRFVYANGSK